MSERTLPHNLESERAILGAALLHPDGLATALSVIRPEDFFRTAHRRIFDAMQGLRIVDLVTLKDALGKAGQLDDIGGPAYLASLVDGVPRSTNVEHYCLGASERILTADLEWVPVGDISTDDKVIGFDEHPILRNKSSRVPRRRWRLASVLRSDPTTAECVRIFFIDGTSVVCTRDHRWLVSGSRKGREWVRADQLLNGSDRRGQNRGNSGRLALRPMRPWTPNTTWSGGWLAGLFDGEGTVGFGDGGGGSHLSVSQKPGLVLDRAVTLLGQYGFKYTHAHRDSGVDVLVIRGGLLEHLRLLGSIRPARLLRDFETKWRARFLQSNEECLVVAVENIGRREIQQIATSTGTYIGEGFLMHNCNIVRDAAILRGVIFASNKALADAYDASDAPSLVVDRAFADLLALSSKASGAGLRRVSEHVHSTFAQLEELSNPDSAAWGHRSGLQSLDRKLRGFRPGKMVVVAGRPGDGKTSIALNVAAAVAKKGVPVGVFSVEMDDSEMMLALVSAEARVNIEDLADQKFSQADWTRVSEAAETFRTIPLYTDYSTDLSPVTLRAKARQMQIRHGLGLVIVDYVQLMSGMPTAKKHENEHEKLTGISRAIKLLAKDLGVPILVCCQLNRAVEGRSDGRPQLGDLRGSGSLEQDADVVILIHDPSKAPKKKSGFKSKGAIPEIAQREMERGVVELIVAKNRGLSTGVVRVLFHKENVRFDNLAL